MANITLMSKKDLMELLDAQRIMDNTVLEKNDPITTDSRFECIQLATMGEISEMMNEIETFKFWKKQRNKRNFLEESVDVLHFLLSLMNQFEEIGYSKTKLHRAITISNEGDIPSENKLAKFLYGHVLLLDLEDDKHIEEILRDALKALLMLQKVRGYEWEDVKKAYYEKNEINLQRQKENY